MRSISNLFKWLRAELKYRITKKKYNVVMSEQVKEFLSEIPEEDRKMLEDEIKKISKNPYVAEPFTEDDWDELSVEEREELEKGLKKSATLRKNINN